MLYTVYVLQSLKDGKLYTGYTKDLPKRLKEHNTGKTKSTRWRAPFVVVYTEEYSDKDEAEAREKYLKSGKGREEIQKLLNRPTTHAYNGTPASGGQ